jgi:RHS repeat-associated protein
MPESIASAQYDAANRLSILDDKSVTYDDNGNIVAISDSNGTTLYIWNARGQLTAINGPSIYASFTYDGLGRREAKTVNGNLTEFLYDGVNPVQETSGATVLANILTGFGIDQFFTRTDVGANTTSHFLTDIVGSTISLTDAAGTVQTEYTYDAFGRSTTTGASNSNPYQYTGRENDGTGLYFYRARYYHPGLQRFISEDPIEFAGGQYNLYAYVDNNPVNLYDPSGLDANTWAYGEIRSWATISDTNFAAPAGLDDAKASIAATCLRGNQCASLDGSNAMRPGDQAAWKNIVNAKGNDLSGGGKYFCTVPGPNNCYDTHCWKCDCKKKVWVKRDSPLPYTGTVTVSGKGVINF